MRLATPDNVLLAMGIGSNAGSLEGASRALDLSFPIIENTLETKLVAGSVVDFFSDVGKATQFRLSNTFVDTDSLVIRLSATGDPLMDETEGTIVPETDYFINTNTGVLVLRKPIVLGDHVLSAMYDYGLPETNGILEAPYWLQETAVSMAILVLNTHPSSPANRKDKTVANVAEALLSLASKLLNAYRRPRLTVEFPVRSIAL